MENNITEHPDVTAINKGEVDSRLSRTRITHPTLPLERTFCSFCGKPKGWVSYDSGDFIDAENVVVVCDDCNAKFEVKLGKIPGEAQIAEVDIRDVEIGVDQAFLDSINSLQSEWIENCVDCRIPMVKLAPMPPNKCAPLPETLRIGGTEMNANRTAALSKAIPTSVPQWYCRKCHSLWGPIDMFWCKFKKL